MRVLFSTLPLSGHFHPLVPVARALVAAGHDVAFACAPSFSSEVKSAGFAVQQAGYDFQGRSIGDLFPEWHAIPEDRRTYWTLPHIFAGVMAPVMASDLLSFASSWRPDVMVRDAAEFGACVAAEVLGVPHALVRTESLSSSYAYRLLVAPQLAQLRARYGLEPDPDMAMLHRFLDLACEPPCFRPPGEAQAPTAHLLRPEPAVTTSADETREWMSDLTSQSGDPLVYASLGTVVSRRPSGREVFEALLRGVRDEPVRLVLTVGRTNDPNDFGPQPPSIRIERYIPQHLLLPHCDLVITHAGFSSITGALSCGVPMVLVPISADQPYNADCCAALGVGCVVRPGAQTADAIRAAVRRVLGDPSYRSQAQQVRDAMAALPGTETATKLLERLARERRPLITDQIA